MEILPTTLQVGVGNSEVTTEHTMEAPGNVKPELTLWNRTSSEDLYERV